MTKSIVFRLAKREAVDPWFVERKLFHELFFDRQKPGNAARNLLSHNTSNIRYNWFYGESASLRLLSSNG